MSGLITLSSTDPRLQKVNEWPQGNSWLMLERTYNDLIALNNAVAGGGGNNIYNTNGTLTGNRIVSMEDHLLTFLSDDDAPKGVSAKNGSGGASSQSFLRSLSNDGKEIALKINGDGNTEPSKAVVYTNSITGLSVQSEFGNGDLMSGSDIALIWNAGGVSVPTGKYIVGNDLTKSQVDLNYGGVDGAINISTDAGVDSESWVYLDSIQVQVGIGGGADALNVSSGNASVQSTGTVGIYGPLAVVDGLDPNNATEVRIGYGSCAQKKTVTIGQEGSGNGVYDTLNIRSLPTLVNYAQLSFANDAAAAAGGVPLGGIYHTAGALKIRIV